MSAYEDVNGWLSELGSSVGQSLALSPDGVCQLAFDEDIEITLEVADETEVVHLHSRVCPVPAGPGREGLLERALTLNLFNQGTEGATLGYDGNTNSLVLYRSWAVDQLDSEALADAIAGHVMATGEVRDRLVGSMPPPERAEHADRAPGEDHPHGPPLFEIRG